MKKKLAVLLAAALTLGMTACGASKGAGDTGKSEKSMVYAVEAGSAGEEAAKEKGFQYNSVSSQADALMEVASGTSDAAIIDLLMAGAMIGEGTSYPNLKHTDELTTEEYGVGCRKGSDLASYINQVFADSYKDGSMEKIAETYGVQEALVEQKDATFEQSQKDSDVDYIKDYTMDLKFSNGETRRVDFLPLLKGNKREELKDINKFIQFGLTHWTLECYNGVDFAPNFLYEQGKKVA